MATRDVLRYDTIVLGAGIAGLACASKLLRHPRYQSGEESLLVLEGRDRIGGRINSVHVDECRLDTGANWIHGIGEAEDRNPLMDILPIKRYRQLSGMVALQPPPSHSDNTVVSHRVVDDDWVDLSGRKVLADHTTQPHGSLVVPTEVAKKLYGGLSKLIGELDDLAEKTSEKEAKQTLVLQAIQKSGIIAELLKDVPAKFHQTFQSIPSFVEVMEAGPLLAQSAEYPQGQPGIGLLEFAIDCYGGDQVFLQDGYLAVIDEIAKDLIAANLVRTGVEVTLIRWDEDPIVIETSEKTYSARKVVCTLPLGVLQHSILPQEFPASPPTKPIFMPQLPEEKLTALRSLGFGTLDKIFLTYPRAWWEDEPFRTNLASGLVNRPLLDPKESATPKNTRKPPPDSLTLHTHSLPGFLIPPTGPPLPGPRPLSCINLHTLTGQPAICIFLSGANAVHIESQSNEVVQKELHDLLWTSLSSGLKGVNAEVPSPTGVHVTRWASDRFSRGSYSHMITGLSEADHREAVGKVLRRSERTASTAGGKSDELDSELRFAGEHTSVDNFATAHGALISGWREADEIIAGLEQGA